MAVAIAATSAARSAPSVRRVGRSHPVTVAMSAVAAMTIQTVSHMATDQGTGRRVSSQVEVPLIHPIIQAL